VLPGRLAPENQGNISLPFFANKSGAIGWGCHGLVAYACQSCVFVVDAVTINTVQTLDGHIAPVSSLCWYRTNIVVDYL